MSFLSKRASGYQSLLLKCVTMCILFTYVVGNAEVIQMTTKTTFDVSIEDLAEKLETFRDDKKIEIRMKLDVDETVKGPLMTAASRLDLEFGMVVSHTEYWLFPLTNSIFIGGVFHIGFLYKGDEPYESITHMQIHYLKVSVFKGKQMNSLESGKLMEEEKVNIIRWQYPDRGTQTYSGIPYKDGKFTIITKGYYNVHVVLEVNLDRGDNDKVVIVIACANFEDSLKKALPQECRKIQAKKTYAGNLEINAYHVRLERDDTAYVIMNDLKYLYLSSNNNTFQMYKT